MERAGVEKLTLLFYYYQKSQITFIAISNDPSLQSLARDASHVDSDPSLRYQRHINHQLNQTDWWQMAQGGNDDQHIFFGSKLKTNLHSSYLSLPRMHTGRSSPTVPLSFFPVPVSPYRTQGLNQ